MDDRQHFEEYREQTAVKHTILEKYIFAYFHILKGTNRNLAYIDGFAGRGTYTSAETGETVEGSPLRVLRKIASDERLARSVSCLFIERDPELAANLKSEVEAFHAAHPNIRKPHVEVDKFAAEVQEGLDAMASRGARLAPAFVFVDPCGVKGTSFATMERVMRETSSSELFIFFNIDGVRRILGLGEVGETLVELVGTEERGRKLIDLMNSKSTPQEREEAILSYYEDLLRIGMGANFITSFRIEHEDKRKTSHYLIHVTRSPLGFKIMKDVMWSVGRTTEGEGALELQQASITGTSVLFRPRSDEVKQEVLRALSSGPRQVRYFYEVLVQQLQNKLSEPAYREALIQLEDEGAIVVLAKDGSGTTASKRQMRNGKKTLAKGYYVRLATNADRAAGPK